MNALFRCVCRLALVLCAGVSVFGADPIPDSDCLDCHGIQDLTAVDRAGRVVSLFVDEAGFVSSVHGAVSCVGCHRGLSREHPEDNVRPEPVNCAVCHEHEFDTFNASVHGPARRQGVAAAGCHDCHGDHGILPSSDPKSSIHPDHRVETCGKCHPGANESFAAGKIHVDTLEDVDLSSIVSHWVRIGYLVVIWAVVGLMAGHNLAVWLHKAIVARRSEKRWVLRMDRGQRLQHLVLMLSFILLAITGFALKYPDSWMTWLLGGDEAVRRWLHRVAGIVLLATAGWHVMYLCTAAEGRRLIRDLWPRRQDIRDVAQHARHLAGRSVSRPCYGRFGYVEKIEYWAVVWGVILMGITGLMIWLRVEVGGVLPRWVVEVALTVHFYEAILACLSIVVWHFYHVVLDPGVYPLNWAWWDGRVSERWYREEHGLDPAPRGAGIERRAAAGESPSDCQPPSDSRGPSEFQA